MEHIVRVRALCTSDVHLPGCSPDGLPRTDGWVLGRPWPPCLPDACHRHRRPSDAQPQAQARAWRAGDAGQAPPATARRTALGPACMPEHALGSPCLCNHASTLHPLRARVPPLSTRSSRARDVSPLPASMQPAGPPTSCLDLALRRRSMRSSNAAISLSDWPGSSAAARGTIATLRRAPAVVRPLLLPPCVCCRAAAGELLAATPTRGGGTAGHEDGPAVLDDRALSGHRRSEAAIGRWLLWRGVVHPTQEGASEQGASADA